MKLIVGLGNPGKKYEKTKHNIGFMTINNFAKHHDLTLKQEKFEGLYVKTNINGEQVIFLEPLTFMNESGRSVGEFARFFAIAPEDILVIQDDLDLPIGKIRIKANGSAGGHNGIKSIIAHLGTQDFLRLKIGIQHPERQKVVDWVLTPFKPVDQAHILQAINEADEIIEDFVGGMTPQALMNKYN